MEGLTRQPLDAFLRVCVHMSHEDLPLDATSEKRGGSAPSVDRVIRITF